MGFSLLASGFLLNQSSLSCGAAPLGVHRECENFPPKRSSPQTKKNPNMKTMHLAAALSGFLTVLLMPVQAAQEGDRGTALTPAAAGILTGTVSNTATRNLLEGARV